MVIPASPVPAVLSAALDYAARGWRVVHLPIRHDGSVSDGKAPAAKAWQKEASSDPQIITLQFTAYPSANVGIVCDRFFVLDFDDLSILDYLPEIPKTLTARTPSGGAHCAFNQLDPPLGNEVAGLRALAKSRGWVPQKGPDGRVRGVDIRGKGGQIVVWPSVSPKNGKRWEWVDPTTPIADAPQWLIDACRPAKVEAKPLPMDTKWGASDPYVERAIAEVTRDLASTVEGSRGSRLFWASARLGELGVSHGDAERALMGACQSNGLVGKDGDASVRRELLRGWEQGAANPVERPEPTARNQWSSNVQHQLTPHVLTAPKPPLRKLLPQGVNECTDLANAHRLVGLYGDDLRFVGSWQRWATWDGQLWRTDNQGMAVHRAKETTLRIVEEADTLAEHGADEMAEKRMKWAVASQSARAIKAMVELAKSDPRIAIEHAAFDSDPWLMNVGNGTLDLKSGALREHRRTDLMTRASPVRFDASAKCPAWRAFLLRIMGDDPRLVSYLQRLIGYAMTGSIREHILAFFYGGGQNGKSTFLNTIRVIMGDYAAQAPRGLLFRQRNAHPTELTDLCGRRFVGCAEVGMDDAFDEPLVKDLTGGEPIRARRMREDFWEFAPTHKLFIAGNHKPTIRGEDIGIWRRIRLIPFTVTIPDDEKDMSLPVKLQAEASGILTWALEGCLEWQRDGIGDPIEVTEATAEYRKESDALGECFGARLMFDGSFRTTKREVTEMIKAWAEDRGMRNPPGARAVAARLREMGAKDGTMRTASGVRDAWVGVALRTDRDDV